MSENSTFDFTYDFLLTGGYYVDPVYPSFTSHLLMTDVTTGSILLDETLTGIDTLTASIIGGHNIQVQVSMLGSVYAELGGHGTFGGELSYGTDITPTGVPEPGTMLLLGSGLLGLGAFRKKFKK